MPATAQINARIDSQLKKDGDEALAKAGLSPSKAIRALWELAVKYRESPDHLLSALYPDRAKVENIVKERERERLRAIANEGPMIIANALSEEDSAKVNSILTLPLEELREIELQERFGKDVLNG